MPEYSAEPRRGREDLPDEPGRLGVLLVNLGTPDAPTAAAVRRFLAQFLWDPRVIEAPRWLWWLVLHGAILRIRPARSAHAYRQIWTADGSPLLLHSQALAQSVQHSLTRVQNQPRETPTTRSGHPDTPAVPDIQAAQLDIPDVPDIQTAHPDIPDVPDIQAAHLPHQTPLQATVALGMSYGSPSISAALERLRAAGVRRLIVLPLYPQYSATTTASVFDRVSGELQRWRRIPGLHFIEDYHDDAAYIEAIAASIREHWRGRPGERRAGAHLLFSFHGIPQRYAAAGDPYHEQCMRSSRLIAARLGLGDGEWSVSFQSQVGREEWLRPYTDQILLEYAQQGRRDVSVVCPGFATDCLETLEEIAIRNRDAFMTHGGERFDYVPALNSSPAHAQLLADLIRRHASGWFAADTAAQQRGVLRQGAAG